MHCNHATKRKSDIKKHYRTHSKDKPYQCEICRKSFSDPSTRSRHMRGHEGRLRFCCSFQNCAKDFGRKLGIERFVVVVISFLDNNCYCHSPHAIHYGNKNSVFHQYYGVEILFQYKHVLTEMTTAFLHVCLTYISCASHLPLDTIFLICALPVDIYAKHIWEYHKMIHIQWNRPCI